MTLNGNINRLCTQPLRIRHDSQMHSVDYLCQPYKQTYDTAE